MKRRDVACTALLFAGVMAWTGCQAVPAPPLEKTISHAAPAAPVSPEVALRDRVTIFWEARLKGDVARQYEFLEPAVKERVPLTAYVRSRGALDYRSYQVQSIHIVGEKGWVKVKSTYKLRVPRLAGFGPWDQEAFEVWALEDGVWHRPYNQQEAATPPPGISSAP